MMAIVATMVLIYNRSKPLLIWLKTKLDVKGGQNSNEYRKESEWDQAY